MPKQITGPLALTLAQPTNADWSSQEFTASQIDTASFIVKTTGVSAATGSFKVMVKNQEGPWVELPLTPSFALANANVSQVILLTDLCFTKLRLDFLRGSAGDNGTFSVHMQGEGVH